MQLSVNGHTLRIGQLGPDFIILDDAAEYPPCRGEITMSIDGRERRWPIELPDGVSAQRLRTRIARCRLGARAPNALGKDGIQATGA